MVQWLRCHAPSSEGTGSTPSQRTKVWNAARQGQKIKKERDRKLKFNKTQEHPHLALRVWGSFPGRSESWMKNLNLFGSHEKVNITKMDKYGNRENNHKKIKYWNLVAKRLWRQKSDHEESENRGDRHTEWSKSEREKQISCINAYMWNLEKWYRWYYLQSRNRDTEGESKHMDTRGEGRLGWIGRLRLTYIHYWHYV